MIVSIIAALAFTLAPAPHLEPIDCTTPDQGSIEVSGLELGWQVLVYPDRVYDADGTYPIPPGDYHYDIVDPGVTVFESGEFTIAPCQPDGDIGEPLEVVRPHLPETSTADVRSGIASHVGPGFGRRYLALPEGPGRTVRICGPAACVTRTSTDAGPSKAMQRAGRVADLNPHDFRTVCGCSPSRGLVRVTVEYASLPPTDTE